MNGTLLIKAEDKGTIHPAADIVAASIAELRADLRRMIGDGVRELTVDFSAVAMLDSAGIGLLVAAHNSLSKVGGRLAIVNASPEILDLLRSMRIHQHFRVSGN